MPLAHVRSLLITPGVKETESHTEYSQRAGAHRALPLARCHTFFRFPSGTRGMTQNCLNSPKHRNEAKRFALRASQHTQIRPKEGFLFQLGKPVRDNDGKSRWSTHLSRHLLRISSAISVFLREPFKHIRRQKKTKKKKRKREMCWIRSSAALICAAGTGRRGGLFLFVVGLEQG